MNKTTEKRPVGRPRNDDPNFERKMAITVSVKPSVEKLAKEAFSTLGNAIEIAVKHRERLLKLEARKK